MAYNWDVCGRYTIIDLSRFTDLFPWIRHPESPQTPRYNVAPSQQIPAIINSPEPKIDFVEWGFLPSWTGASEKPPRPMINARAETLGSKRMFKDALRKRRCLLPADGFYEWKTRPSGERVPVYFRLKSGRPFAFAGLWDNSRRDGLPLTTCTMITTGPNKLVEPIHDRMPVILMEEDYQKWIDSAEKEPEELLSLLRPYPAEQMEAIEVKKTVNSPKNEGPDCIEPDIEGLTKKDEEEPTLF
jgi:putative SOS response-associated peptidase YedK